MWTTTNPQSEFVQKLYTEQTFAFSIFTVLPKIVIYSKEIILAMAPTKPAAGGRPKVPTKKIIDTIREATGASDEDIKSVLEECNNDVNEATARLIDSAFLFVRR